MCPLWWRLMSVRPSVCSSEHTPAEVRPAPPSWHANHDAPRHCSGAAHRSTQPRLLCPVLHLQPTTVRQSAAGAADDALPVTSRIYCDSRVCFCTSHPLAAQDHMQVHIQPLGCRQHRQGFSFSCSVIGRSSGQSLPTAA